MDLKWIAVRSKPRAEKVAFDQLIKNDIEAYLPLIKKKRKWSDRKKWVDFPLFSSYLFAKIELKNSIYVLQTYGVNTIVKFNNTILTIPENVIKSIQLAIEGGYELQPVEYFTKGDDDWDPLSEIMLDTPTFQETTIGVEVLAFKDQILIRNVQEETNIKIYNMRGALVKNFKINSEKQLSFATGMWIITAENSKGAKVVKVLTY